MVKSSEHIRDQVFERLFRIYTNSNRDLLISIQKIVAPQAVSLAAFFYDQMLELDETGPFLNHQVVSDRLHRSMTKWIETLFLPNDERSVADHMKWQSVVGDVHARINVPMRLVNHGIRLLKQEIGGLIMKADLEPEQKYQGFILVNDLLDFSSSLINESYIAHRIDNENDMQALKLHMMSVSVVVEIERLRASLFDWLRKMVTDIYQKFPDQKPALSSIYNTEFGLWLLYKAELIYSERPDLIQKLKRQLNRVEENIEKINNLSGKDLKTELSLALEYLSENISSTAWLLGEMSTHAYEMESGKDTLTRLFNRRFLPSIMQNFIKAAKTSSTTFSILFCDLDEFKKVNDTYGHDAGDKALISFGEFLVSSVRATDYVFRMSGDEFCIVLAGADGKTAVSIAQKILVQLRYVQVKIDETTSLSLKSSIGVVQYDGHPDYERILKDADGALYQAKKKGKNSYHTKQ